MTYTILVTGAAGKTGLAVIRSLAKRGVPVRALVRREHQAALTRSVGASEITVGDLLVDGTLHKAAEGTRAIYHICPNMHPDEVVVGKKILAAARNAGVGHFVYHSVLHPQTAKMPHHWNKLQVEEVLFESGLPFTILQPAPYMQNLLANRQSIAEQGVYSIPYPAETRLSLVDLRDIGEAAAVVLSEPGHLGTIYELAGTEPLAQTDVARILSQVLDRSVVIKGTPLDDWRSRAEAAGHLSDYAVETLIQMFRYYANFGLAGNPRVLGYLLGRAPTSLADFAAREMA